jgi:hypothetical protein
VGLLGDRATQGLAGGRRVGGWGAQHAQAYLDEFVFRFNRRTSNARGLLFYRLLQNAVVMRKATYATIVLSRRGDAGKLRGPKRTRRWSQSAITGTPAARGSNKATAAVKPSKGAAPSSATALGTSATRATPKATKQTTRTRSSRGGASKGGSE